MKKRILALALAGTTAFSVFGAAMSASAATSTHVWYGDDQYTSYKAPAQKITVTATSETVGREGAYALTDPDYVNAQTASNGLWYTGADGINKIEAIANTKENYVRKFWAEGISTREAATEWDIADSLTKDDLKVLGVQADVDYGGETVGYIYKGSKAANLYEIVKVILADTSLSQSWNYHRVADTSNAGSFTEYRANEITADAYADLLSWSAYKDKYVIYGTKTNYDPTIVVEDANGKSTEYTSWTFNSTVTDIMDTEVAPSGVLYAYDFYWDNNWEKSVGSIASGWNDKDVSATASALVDVTKVGDNGISFNYETGDGHSNKGVRFDVINDWVDFLEELAINKDNGYYETEAEFVQNYVDMYYGDPVYSSATGKLVGYNYVDLYNIDQLLHDIYTLNNKAAYSQANTSQLVYLMQQYDKYIGEYITPSEVETSEWGELLLSVLESANSSDFKKENDYKKYTREVEDLADAYADATTTNMIAAAEQGMYDLLVSSRYTATSVDKTDLAATMSGLFFNAKSVPSTYTEDNGTVVYKNYDYVATGEYYTLYPMADYAEQGNYNKNAIYTGNTAAKDDPYVVTTYVTYDRTTVAAESTDEYQWFWNVYQLAYNMNKSNKYQGAIDAVNDALVDAVEALEVTTTPANSAVVAKEEAIDDYADMIESDYVAGYYAKYAQAMDYAENVAEGKYQTALATKIVEIAGGSLTYQGAQITVTKNDITGLKSSISDGEKALKAIKEDKNYNAAQVNALNKAIAKANSLIELYEGSLYSAPDWYHDRYSNLLQSVNHISWTGKVGDKDQMVKSDIDNAIDAINAAIDYSEIVMGWSKNDAGKWLYGTENGYLNNGWNKIGSVWYYFNEDGTAKQSEWMQENGKWYWFNSNAGAAIGWAKVDNQWYYFGGDNAMKTGWQKVDGSWYYLASSGRMITGWAQVDGKWYYMSKESNSLGQMLANTTTPDGYKVGADGAMIEK